MALAAIVSNSYISYGVGSALQPQARRRENWQRSGYTYPLIDASLRGGISGKAVTVIGLRMLRNRGRLHYYKIMSWRSQCSRVEGARSCDQAVSG